LVAEKKKGGGKGEREDPHQKAGVGEFGPGKERGKRRKESGVFLVLPMKPASGGEGGKGKRRIHEGRGPVNAKKKKKREKKNERKKQGFCSFGSMQ